MSLQIETVDVDEADNAYYELVSKATIMGRLFDAAMIAKHADVSLDWGSRSDDESFWRGLDMMTRDIITLAGVMNAAIDKLYEESQAPKKGGSR